MALFQLLCREFLDFWNLDTGLSDKLQFVEEIGYGNWGSVWLCRPKEDPDSPNADGLVKLQETKIAVKLVHRSKTSTTAARVRSLYVAPSPRLLCIHDLLRPQVE